MDNMQLWLSSSTDSINLNDRTEGFYLNPDLEGLTGLPEIRSVNGLNAGYDGGWTATQLWAARLITIRGVIAINDKAAVETKRKALAKLLAQGKNEDLELRFVSEAGNTYTTTVRTTNCTMALQRVFWRQDYQIQLRANDPLIYDDGGSELVAILRVMAGEGGFEIPFDIPFTIGGSIDPTSVDVGDEATYPLIRLKGDLHNPTIISMTTNQRMQVLADIITTIEWHDYTTTYTADGYKQIGDGLDGAPLSLAHLYGNATQETLRGVNLIQSRQPSGSANGITWTLNSDGSVKVSGTATANQTISFGSVSMEQGKTYTLSGCPSGGAVGKYMLYTNVVNPQFIDTGSGATQTVSANATAQIYFIVYSGRTVDGTIYPQLELGSTATSYEPYVGGSPMPNPQFPSPVETVTGAQTVKITGKNLCTNAVVDDGNHVSFYCDIGTIKSNTITLTAIIDKATTSNSVYAFVDGINTGVRIGGFTGTAGGTGQATLDLSGISSYLENGQILRAQVYKSSAGFTSVSDAMIVNGSTPEPFEPYQSQSQEINLGKNLLGLQDTAATELNDVTISVQDGTISLDGTASASFGVVVANLSEDLRLSNGIDYAISMKTISGSAGHDFDVQLRDGSDANIFSINSSYLPTSRNTLNGVGKKLRLYIASGTVFNDYKIAFQIEKGTQATPYAPYKTPIELAKIGNYTDGFRIIDGAWYIHKEVGKVVYDGSEAGWFAYSSNVYAAGARLTTIRESLCDYAIFMPNVSTAGALEDKKYCWASEGNDYRPLFKRNDIADLATWKTWLSTHNTTVYYPLATPTDTEITDSELIEQLNHIYSLYQGTNNLWLIPNAGAQGEMEVSYATAEDIDYHEVVIDCQARTVTQDGHNLYPALAEGSEFIRLLPGENKLYLTSEVESDNGTAEVKFKKGNISI